MISKKQGDPNGEQEQHTAQVLAFFLSQCEVRDGRFIVSLKLPFSDCLELNLFNEMNR